MLTVSRHSPLPSPSNYYELIDVRQGYFPFLLGHLVARGKCLETLSYLAQFNSCLRYRIVILLNIFSYMYKWSFTPLKLELYTSFGFRLIKSVSTMKSVTFEFSRATLINTYYTYIISYLVFTKSTCLVTKSIPV